MNRDANLLEMQSRLLRLDHEILLLKFKAEEARPNVMAECCCYVKELREQYEALAYQLQVLKEVEGDAWVELQTAVDGALRDLYCRAELVGTWVRLRLVDCFSVGVP
jgi:hypothetical protein